MTEPDRAGGPSQLAVEVAEGITVVRILTDRILEDDRILELRTELMGLVEGARRLLIDFSGVQLMSSACLGVLIQLDRAIRASGGTTAIFGIRPEISEVFTITHLDRFFEVFGDRDSAIRALREHILLIPCPVRACRGRARVYCRAADLDRARPTCPECGARLVLSVYPEPDSGREMFCVAELAIPTYEKEWVRILPARRTRGVPPGGPFRIEIEGRLDLFAADSLKTAWLTIPPPRCMVFDLRKTTELTEAGIDALLSLGQQGDGNRTAILLPERQAAGPLAGLCPLFAAEADALAALGDIPEAARRPLTVTLLPEP